MKESQLKSRLKILGMALEKLYRITLTSSAHTLFVCFSEHESKKEMVKWKKKKLVAAAMDTTSQMTKWPNNWAIKIFQFR